MSENFFIFFDYFLALFWPIDIIVIMRLARQNPILKLSKSIAANSSLARLGGCWLAFLLKE
jgi:hypothetical protein